MAKVTIEQTETPSQAVVRAANAEVVAVDVRGRQIALKKMNALDRMRLYEVVGPENVNNHPYLGMASLAYMASRINDDPVIRPTSKRELEALVQQLDEDGLEAIATTAEKHFMDSRTSDEVKNAAKNG